MAIVYNSRDGVAYGTNAERVADAVYITQATQKFYEYDTGNVYITNGTTWYLM